MYMCVNTHYVWGNIILFEHFKRSFEDDIVQ